MDLDGALVDLDITPSPSNSPDDLSNLERELFEKMGELHLQSHCDKYLCKVKSAKTSLISSLATDSRVLRVEMGPVLTIHNSNASMISGVDYARSLSELDLRGEGEVIGISDTGLDVDHGDFGNRLRNPIYNLFGPDSSGADSNSGHGTHVTATLLGDGTGDSNSTGIVPESTFHFYQLEVDSSGILARWGSLYDMFEHSFLNDANIHTNSWGSESLVREYTSDSR
jgi:Subtilisin-like serine proteases